VLLIKIFSTTSGTTHNHHCNCWLYSYKLYVQILAFVLTCSLCRLIVHHNLALPVAFIMVVFIPIVLLVVLVSIIRRQLLANGLLSMQENCLRLYNCEATKILLEQLISTSFDIDRA